MDSGDVKKPNNGEKQNIVPDIIGDILVMGLLQTGVLYQMSVWFQLGYRQVLSLGTEMGLLLIAMVVLHYVIRREQYVYILAGAAAVIALLVKGPGSVYYGFFGMVNYMISWWNVSREDAVQLVMEDRITSDNIYAGVLAVIILMTILWYMSIRGRKIIVTALIVLAWIAVGLVVDAYSCIGCGALIAGWLGVLTVSSNKSTGVRNLAWMAAVSAACILISSVAGNGREQSLVEFRQNVDDTVEGIRYGEDTLPQGDLSKADELLNGDDDTLVVSSEVKKDMYLKGFVGARYVDGSWSELPLADYKGGRSGMLMWLSERGFMPVDQYSTYAGIDPELGKQENLVTVKNVGASRRYIYAPYSAEIPDGALVNVNEDMNYLSMGFFGAKNYEFVEMSGDRPGELLYAAAWANAPQTDDQQTYVDAENVYADFVYDNYLQVDDDMASMLEDVFFGDDWDGENTIYGVTERIREVLEKQTVYREQPEMAPDGTDPVSWFLNRGHQGNAVMYASAAALAFRTQGIPARYVEGYRVAGDKLGDDPDSPLTLTNRDSHAWVEVYLDSVGWVPVDVTPGFYYDTYTLLQMVQRPQNVNQSAVSDNSNDQGSQLDRSTESPKHSTERSDRDRKVTVPLDILAILILIVVCVFVFMELRRFIRRFTEKARYDRLPASGRIRVLSDAIFTMVDMYGCSSGLGWNAAEVDELLASGLPGFYPGEYVRITELLEKNIYGGEELSDGELRTLYIFAEKLYQARGVADLRKRLKIRYGL